LVIFIVEKREGRARLLKMYLKWSVNLRR